MEKLVEYLPFIVPLALAQLIVLGLALYHILTHKTYKHGNRVLWIVVTLVFSGFVGPILYFLFGKEDA